MCILNIKALGLEEFLCFSYISLCKTCHPKEGPFWPQEHNFNKLGTSLLDDDTYQISRVYAWWFNFQTRRFFKYGQNQASSVGDVLCSNSIVDDE